MICPLCVRNMPEELMQRHHLLTQRVDKKAVEKVCRECHKTIHGLWSDTDLRDFRNGLDTLEGISSQPEFQKAVAFIRKVPPGVFMRMKDAQRKKR